MTVNIKNPLAADFLFLVPPL